MNARIVFAPALLLAFLLASCGGKDEEIKEKMTYEKQESTTLKQEGSAESPAEVARREAEAEEKARRNKSAKALFTWQGRLDKAREKKDAMDIAEALTAIAELGPEAESFAEKLPVYFDYDDVDVKIAALNCLASIQGDKARPRLEALLKSKDADLKKAAVRYWGKAKIQDPTPVLPLLDDIEGDVQYEAVKALSTARIDVELLLLLKKKLGNLDGPAGRQALALVFEKRALLGGDASGMVVEALDHQDAKVRTDAIDLAKNEKILPATVVQKLVRILDDDPEEDVRRRAHDVLKSLAGGDAPAYDPSAEDDVRRKPAKAWSEWFEANKGKFGG